MATTNDADAEKGERRVQAPLGNQGPGASVMVVTGGERVVSAPIAGAAGDIAAKEGPGQGRISREPTR
jgi:hypothetical protein